jgi:hypothetical protein
MDLVPVDTLAPLSWFSRTGYYVVDNKIFRHKIYAMQEATRKRIKPQDVSWVFNNDVYDNLDWKTPSNLALSEVYRSRAQQLREKYDYLMVSFSGGGDSSNVLDSFVLNNIHLDEVVIYWPHKHTSGKYVASLDPDSTNFLSEWDYLIEPKLKWLQTASPKTKITILDWTEQLESEEPQENLIELTPHHNYLGYKRYKELDKLLSTRQTQHKNYAFVTGINPPGVTRIHNHLMVYFSEGPAASYGADYTVQGLCRNVEFFYWTPDMPEIVRAQSQALLNYLQTFPKFIDMVPVWEIGNKRPKQVDEASSEALRRLVKQVLYPTYNSQALQVNKNTSPLLIPEWYSWFYNNPHCQEIIQPHQSGIVAHQNLIDPSFFVTRDNEVHAYYQYRSKLYHVGNLW